MASLDQDMVPHNPAVEPAWTDAGGRSWDRHGGWKHPLDRRRIVTLLRRADVPLVFYQGGAIRWIFDLHAQSALWNSLEPKTADDYDGNDGVRVTEWRSVADEPLLMFDQSC